ncbi:MAG: amidohydrolase [Ilumatobacteraceae bacterium]
MSVDDVGVRRPIDHWLGEHGEGLIAIRRQMHAHPELSGEEHATTELVGERLRLAGLEPRELASGTGLVCDLAADGDQRPRLALRADLDALAMHDEKDVHYRSQVDGVAHACGHDVHTTIMLGTALYYAHHRDELPGPLRFVFQPAEERVPGGAIDTIADSALDGVEAIVGVHCDPKLDVGHVGLKAGAISSAADMALITLIGPGGHTARPEETVDMITVASRVVQELPAMVAAELDDPDSVKVVFGMINSGDAANVIPSHCSMKVSVRTPSDVVWEALPEIFERVLPKLLADTGARHELEYTHGVPPVVNHEAMTSLVREAATIELGVGSTTPAVQSWGGDDFAWYLREVPGTYVRVGTHDPAAGGPRLDLHAGSFDVDEAAIGVGVRVIVRTAAHYFAGPPPS